MHIITLDFETHFDSVYTLSKLTTEEYIRDPRFAVHGVAMRLPDGTTIWDHEPQHVFAQIDWGSTGVLAHHAHFDGLILSHHYGIRPAYWLDTLSMSRVLFDQESNSLEALAMRFGLPTKNVPYSDFKGKHWNELSHETRMRLADGAKHDCDLTWTIARHMLAGGHPAVPYAFPASELDVIDLTVRMFTEPVLRGDLDKLATAWLAENKQRRELFASAGVTPQELRKDQAFADILRAEGVEPQTKTTKKGNTKYAFAKSDWFMQDLITSPNERIAMLAEARLKAHSSIYQTRCERLGFAAQRGLLPVYLAYAAAHTRRWGGGDHCLTGDTVVVVFDPQKGQCEKKIIDVLLDDLVWDGEEFVAHDGVVFQGYAEVIEHDGVKGTKDHKVFVAGGETTLGEARRLGLALRACPEPQ